MSDARQKKGGGSCAPRYRHSWGPWTHHPESRLYERRECHLCGRWELRPLHLASSVPDDYYTAIGREGEA